MYRLKNAALFALLMVATIFLASHHVYADYRPVIGCNGALHGNGVLTPLSCNDYAIYTDDYGAQGDGVTDDSASLVAAGNAAIANHSNLVYLTGKVGNVFAVGTSGNLTLPAGVEYHGSYAAFGYNANFATAPYTLLLNPANTIILGSSSALVGVRIYPQGMGQQASTLRGALTQIANFAGTALTILANTNDFDVDHVMINGFNQAIYQYPADRGRYHYVAGDDVNGLFIGGGGDNPAADRVEFWNFMSSPYALGSAQTQTTAISSFSSGPGGALEVAFASAPATPIITGDIVIIGNTAATYQAPNCRWKATAIDASHFTINAISGVTACATAAYTTLCPSACSATNEVVYMTSSLRQGIAFSIVNTGLLMSNLVEYGHDVGYQYGSGTDGMACVTCWSDGDADAGTFADPVPLGIVSGSLPGVSPVATSHGSWQGKVYDKARALYVNNSSGRNGITISESLLNTTGAYANVQGAGATVVAGAAYISNTIFDGAGSGYVYYVGDAASFLKIDGGTSAGGSPFYQTFSTDCPKFVFNGAQSCGWTPTDASGAGLTFTAPVVSCTETFATKLVACSGAIIYPTTADTSAASIGGLPSPVALYATAPVITSTTISGGVTAAAIQSSSKINLYSSTGNATFITNTQLSGVTIYLSFSYYATN